MKITEENMCFAKTLYIPEGYPCNQEFILKKIAEMMLFSATEYMERNRIPADEQPKVSTTHINGPDIVVAQFQDHEMKLDNPETISAKCQDREMKIAFKRHLGDSMLHRMNTVIIAMEYHYS